MADSPYIHDVTTENFEARVVQASFEAPVLVDFWAPWCGPCKSLTPILEKLADEYQGGFTVAKINTDDEQMLAGQLGIRSLPTVMLIKDGQQLDGFMGAQPESAVRAMLERHIGSAAPAGDQRREQATALLAAGRADEAVALLRVLSADDPDDHELQLDLARALLQTGASDEVRKILDGLPEDQQQSDAAKGIRARLSFADLISEAPDPTTLRQRLETDPTDHEARHLLGARLLVAGDYEAALEQFFELMKRDRSYRDDLGRRSLVDAFSVVDDPALVARFRQRMASLLF